ncbi:MAG: tetratricopeptide repeat protein [Gemmatimonadetes bacterium]|nr:tetratricopeptide repeat protein [Gemmatimonadota bacterium]
MKRDIAVRSAGAVALLIAVGWGVAEVSSRERPAATAVSDAVTSVPDQRLERLISTFSERAREDPFSAGDQALLANLYLQRARETGNYEYVLQAESAARQSLKLREAYNSDSWGTLSLTLLEQHRFVEARQAAERLLSSDPESPAFRAHLAEINLELGDYRAAAAMFRSVEANRSDPDVAPRLAHWLELTGRTDEARTLLYSTREAALRGGRIAGERAAWMHLRIGDLELRNGRLDEAEEAFRAGLAAFPGDYRILAAMARLEAARRNWERSTAYGDAVLGQVLDPSVLIMLSEVAAARGDTAAAAEYAQVLEISIQEQKSAYHRDWSLFLLDRGSQTEEVLARAETELKTRRDVYGYDLLAWALHKVGRNQEAAAAMKTALRLGTRDAMLLYHAGMIDRALGNDASAAKHLAEALRINPSFHPAHAPAARRALSAARGPWYQRVGLWGKSARRGDV